MVAALQNRLKALREGKAAYEKSANALRRSRIALGKAATKLSKDKAFAPAQSQLASVAKAATANMATSNASELKREIAKLEAALPAAVAKAPSKASKEEALFDFARFDGLMTKMNQLDSIDKSRSGIRARMQQAQGAREAKLAETVAAASLLDEEAGKRLQALASGTLAQEKPQQGKRTSKRKGKR